MKQAVVYKLPTISDFKYMKLFKIGIKYKPRDCAPFAIRDFDRSQKIVDVVPSYYEASYYMITVNIESF